MPKVRSDDPVADLMAAAARRHLRMARFAWWITRFRELGRMTDEEIMKEWRGRGRGMR